MNIINPYKLILKFNIILPIFAKFFVKNGYLLIFCYLKMGFSAQNDTKFPLYPRKTPKNDTKFPLSLILKLQFSYYKAY